MSKTNLAKRMLSILLSVLMIVTSIPFTAIPASAAEPSESGLVGSYLTKNITDGMKTTGKEGNIYWDANEGAARFDGSGYLTLDGKPMEAVNSSTGFTISLDFKRDSTSTAMIRLFDFNDGSTGSLFSLNAGADGNNERYITFATPNATELRYWANDLGDSTKCDPANEAWLNNEKPNTWYNITVTMETNGKYSFYVDGDLKGTFRSNYGAILGSSVTPEQIMNSFSGFTRYMIGGSAYANDAKFSGYIKNIKLYDRAVDITSAIAGGGATNIEVLGNAMREFESRMDGKVYTNMGTAYDAYVAANKAYDVVYYGGDSSIDADRDVITSTNNLVREILNMGKMNFLSFVQQTANVKPTFNSGDTSGYYSNVLYSSTGNPATGPKVVYFSGGGGGWGASDGSYEAKCHTNNSIVLLYDGSNDVMFPVTLEGLKTKTSGTKAKPLNVKTYSASTDNTSWELKGDWNGQETKWNNFPNNTYSMSKTSGDTTKAREFPSGTKTYVFGNGLKFKGSFANDSYYQTFNSSNNIFIKHYMNGGVDTWTDYTRDLKVFDGANVYVINYKSLLNLIKTGTFAELAKVSSYREGGLTDYSSAAINGLNFKFSNYDFSNAANVGTCASYIGTIVNGLKNPTKDNTDNYPALRNAFDYSGKITTMGDDVVYSVREAYNGGVRKGFSKDSYDNFEAKYVAAQNIMKAVRENGYANGSGAATAASELLAAFNALEPVNVQAPTLTESTVLGPNDTIVITNNETSGTVKYTIAYDGGTASAETVYSGDINVFNGSTSYREAVVTAYCTVGTDDSKSVSQTYTFYKAPTINSTDGALLSEVQTIEITSNNDTQGTIQYSYDNSTWKNYTAPVAPFTENKKTTANLYAREIYGNATSATVQVLNLVKKATFNILSSTEDNSFNSTSTFTFSDISGYDDDILYTLRIDGVTSGPHTYDKKNGIVVADNPNLVNAKLVEITAYAKSQGGSNQKVTAKFFNSDNYNPLAYQESFDGASVSGTTFTTGSDKGKNGTLYVSGSVSVVDGAGYKDNAGYSPDWRENVLKVNTATAAPGNKVTLNENPLADEGVNAAAAKSSGATITFWRHIEDASGNTITNPGDGWLGGVAFQNKGDNGFVKPYFFISNVGYISLQANGLDIKPDNQGITKHSVGNNSGHWVQVAVSIDPSKGVSIYTNGEKHDVVVSVNGSPSYNANGPEFAQAVLDYITTKGTAFSICNSLGNYNSCNIFYDDIRIYSTAMTQTEINNMYVDKYADVQKKSAAGHDPTTVAVYTLTSGKQVGETYIEKNNAYDQIASVEYYMFGTGMTIYHSTDCENWEIVGDSQGRCNYQNEDLFGAPYTTALAEPLAIAAQDSGRDGAGKLVWAPHVMYNLSINKWCYYGSTSSWGSQISAIFLCTSDNITGPYTYDSIVVTSTSHPNAIDPVVFYDKDFSNLYMLYGSWGGDNAIYYVNIAANGKRLNDGINNVVCRGINTGLEQNCTDGGSGEGAYVIYDNGYYYLYVSYGQNTGSYTTRVFRSKDPVSGYVDADGTSALDNTTATMHGNQFIHPFDLPIYDYAYNSTGHNSVFISRNAAHEKVTLNSVHARPFATAAHGYKALDDSTLSTRQVDLNGNTTLVNQVGYTKSAWPVLMPYQYSIYDTVKPEYTSADIEGTYIYQSFTTKVNYDILGYIEITFKATGDYTGVMHNGTTAYDYVISKAEDGTTLINVYDTRGIIFEGVIGEHNDNRRRTVPQMGFVNVRTGENAWAYMSSQNVSDNCDETVNVTFENLFSFDKFVNSSSASTTTSKGTASYDAVNRTITTVCNVEGDNDNYTDHTNLSTVYKIPVTPGKTYYLDFTADNANADAMIFVPNDYDSGYDEKYTNFRGGHVNGQNRLEIKVPDGKNYVYFRFGSTNVFGATVTFSNIVFYEASRADYRGNIGSYEKTTTCGSAYGTLPTPTKDGYHFVGWYSDTDYNYPVTAETIAVHSPNAQNLYAKWEAHSYDTVMTESGSIYTWTDTCSCDDTQPRGSVDANSYFAKVAKANADMDDTARYTPESIAELQKVVNSKTLTFTKDNVLTQAEVDDAATAIGSADNTVDKGGKLVLRTYTVTFNYIVDDKNQVENIYIEPKEYKYGDIANLSTTDKIPDKTIPYKWTYTIGNNGEEILLAKATTSASVVVTNNITVTVFLANDKDQTEESKTVRVNLYDKSKRLIGVAYTTGSTISFTDTSVDVNGSTLTPTRIPFYNAKGFNIGDTTYSSSNTTYDIPEGTKVVDIYTNYVVENKIKITVPADVQLNGKNVTTAYYEATWNEMIILNANSEVDWYANDKLVGKGTTYAFRANANVTITTQPAQVNVTPSTSIGYFAYDVELNRVSVVNNFYAPNAKEAGVILSTKYSTVEDVKKYGQKFGVTSENFTKDKNQVRISVSRKATTSFTMYAVSYVVAADGQTYYSDAVSVCNYVAS